MDAQQIAAAVQALGIVGILALALLAGYRRIWMWRKDHDDQVTEWRAERERERAEAAEELAAMRAEKDEWRAMALDGLKVGADVAQAAKRHTILTPEEAEAALTFVELAKHAAALTPESAEAALRIVREAGK